MGEKCFAGRAAIRFEMSKQLTRERNCGKKSYQRNIDCGVKESRR